MAVKLDFERLRGFDRQTDILLNICNSRVTFGTEKKVDKFSIRGEFGPIWKISNFFTKDRAKKVGVVVGRLLIFKKPKSKIFKLLDSRLWELDFGLTIEKYKYENEKKLDVFILCMSPGIGQKMGQWKEKFWL